MLWMLGRCCCLLLSLVVDFAFATVSDDFVFVDVSVVVVFHRYGGYFYVT